MCPLPYLGLQIHEMTVTPQHLAITDETQTLCNFKELCGTVNWVQPLLGISTESLAPLFNLLRGDSVT